MSVKNKRSKKSWGNLLFLFALMAGYTEQSQAFDILQTVPDVIYSGVTLPGDTAPVPCPVVKDFDVPLSLDEAVDIALCNNPQIKMTWANIKIQSGALGEARSAYLPTITGSASRITDTTHSSGEFANSSSIKSNTLYGSINWRLFDFGGREANRKAAESLLSAAMANHDATLQKTFTAVLQAYFDALTASATIKAKTKNEEIVSRTLESAQRKEKKGLVSRGDTLQVNTALAKASLEKSRAYGAYQKALSVLVYALGVPSSTRILLPDETLDQSPISIGELREWITAAEQRHPAIVAARAELEAAQYKVTATKSEGLPTLDFSGNYYQNGRPGQSLTPSRTRETTVGIVLTIPIFDGFSRNYKIRGAQAQVEQKTAELEDTEHQILMEVVKAHADTISAQVNLSGSEALMLAAQESLAVAERRYEKGAADILEILNTQAALVDAEQERIRCLAEWWSARLRLLSSAGKMGRAAVER